MAGGRAQKGRGRHRQGLLRAGDERQQHLGGGLGVLRSGVGKGPEGGAGSFCRAGLRNGVALGARMAMCLFVFEGQYVASGGKGAAVNVLCLAGPGRVRSTLKRASASLLLLPLSQELGNKRTGPFRTR